MDENKSLADANSGIQNDTQANANKEPAAQSGSTDKAGVQQAPASENKQEVKQIQKPAVVHSDTKPQVKKRRFHLYHIKNAVKKAHPYNIKTKLEHYRFEYSRILHLARKPTRQEFKELSIMVIVGTFIIGLLGFVIQMIIQVI